MFCPLCQFNIIFYYSHLDTAFQTLIFISFVEFLGKNKIKFKTFFFVSKEHNYVMKNEESFENIKEYYELQLYNMESLKIN
jgi:hypothetical protein